MAALTSNSSQISLGVVQSAQPAPRVSQVGLQVAYGPPASRSAGTTQTATLIARTGGSTNVVAKASQISMQVAYRPGISGLSRSDAWTYVLDGHRFYVLPLGAEGDWAYDTTTKEWSQLRTQGFDGLNFKNGVMWQDIRIMGGDSLYPSLLEMDPNQPFDDDFRPVEHIVTGGLATRGRYSIGVANFTLTASVGEDASVLEPISLAFSDDNGVTWSKDFNIPLTDVSTQQLIWNSLGTYTAPGRVFRITDYGGPVRLDGADAVLSVPSGADSGQPEVEPQ